MAYFTDSNTRERLYIMYFLSRINTELTAQQITTAMLECSTMECFDLLLMLGDLEDSGYVAAVPYAYGQALSLTKKGRDALEMFCEELPLSTRNDFNDYIEENYRRIISLGQFSARKIKDISGGYNACMCAYEKNHLLLSVSIHTVSPELAGRMCENWESRSHLIYKAVSDILLPLDDNQ